MKKNVLALSIAAMIGGIAGTASAGVIDGSGVFDNSSAPSNRFDVSNATKLQLAENGKGHILIVPYYTAQNDNVSVIHLVNTDSKNGKAVKVRFRGAANSDDVLDFTVFLSPSDVWTGYVAKGSDGRATFTTADKSCVIPQDIGTTPKSFVTSRLNNQAWADADAKNAQTREGYIELLNMADVPSKSYGTQSALYTTIKHVGGKAPCWSTQAGSDTLLATTELWDDGDLEEANAAALGLNTPTGGLFADWYIQNVGQTTTYSGSSPAVIAVDDSGNPARAKYTFFSQKDVPYDEGGLAATPDNLTADPLLRGSLPLVLPSVFDFPDLSTPYVDGFTGAPIAQASNLAQALAVTSVSNQYATDPGIFAQSDWVISMPTRRYSVAANYKTKPATPVYSSGGVSPDLEYVQGVSGKPFFSGNNLWADSQGRLCVRTASFQFWDREEQIDNNVRVSPSEGVIPLCGEVSVMAFGNNMGAKTSVLGASIARTDLGVSYVNGWGTVRALTNASIDGSLPMMGHSFTKLVNPAATPGVSGNYGITWAHRFDPKVAPAATAR